MNRLSTLITIAAGASLACAGPLTPPVGPVAPSGPTLNDLFNLTDAPLADPISDSQQIADQLETRTDVLSLAGDAGAAHVITQPGSYYLSGNLIVNSATLDGIRIDSDNVTLDLNGQRVVNTFGGNTAQGIMTDNSDDYYNVGVRNGFIEDWGREGILIIGFFCRVENVTVRDVQSGIIIVGEGSNLVTGCRVENQSIGGLALGLSSINYGNVMADNHLRSTSTGFTTGGGTALRDCTAVGVQDSFGFVPSSGSVLTRCVALAGGTSGFSSFTNPGCVYQSCTSSGNQQYGIAAQRATVRNCLAQENGLHGFYLSQRNHVFDCTAIDNEGAGFFLADQANRVDSNHAETVALLGGLGDNGVFAANIAQDSFVVRNSAANMFDTFSNTAVNPSLFAADWFDITLAGPWDNLSQ